MTDWGDLYRQHESAVSALAGDLSGDQLRSTVPASPFSRRSRSQMRTQGLPLSPEQLDDLCIFGPREDDQPVP